MPGRGWGASPRRHQALLRLLALPMERALTGQKESSWMPSQQGPPAA